MIYHFKLKESERSMSIVVIYKYKNTDDDVEKVMATIDATIDAFNEQKDGKYDAVAVKDDLIVQAFELHKENEFDTQSFIKKMKDFQRDCDSFIDDMIVTLENV